MIILFIRDITRIIGNMVKENMYLRKENSFKVIGRMELEMEKVV